MKLNFFKSAFTLAEVPEARQHIRHWSKGFTLAEVLITLAIIGIVAALTIPTLVQNFQSRAWDTASEVFQKKLEESLKVMNVQGTLAGYTTTEAFVDELSKHIKITKICKNDDLMSCFEDKVYWGTGDIEPSEVEMQKIKNAKDFGQEEWDTEVIGAQFANGTSGLIAYNPDCRQDPYSNQVTGTSCLAILYDTSAYRNPNTSGKDLRSINVLKLGNECAIELEGLCFSTAFIPDKPMTMAECNAEKEKLGIEYCCFGHEEGFGGDGCDDYDYWGAAVRQCGGVNNMPTLAQLEILGKYLYKDDNFKFLNTIVEDMYESGLTEEEMIEYSNSLMGKSYIWDEERVAALGITPIVGDGMSVFAIFSREYGRYGSINVQGAIFTNNFILGSSPSDLAPNTNNLPRDFNTDHAICVY